MPRPTNNSKCVCHGNAHNLIGRGTFELDRAQRTLKMLINVQDQWVQEMELEAED